MDHLPDDWKVATIPPLAAHLGVAQVKVARWIESGELPAANLATRPTGRPVWRIRREDFEAFWTARSAPSPAPKATRKRKRGGKQYV